VKVALEIYNMKRLKELTILFLRYNISWKNHGMEGMNNTSVVTNGLWD
jgi:hypothetical protein